MSCLMLKRCIDPNRFVLRDDVESVVLVVDIGFEHAGLTGSEKLEHARAEVIRRRPDLGSFHGMNFYILEP